MLLGCCWSFNKINKITYSHLPGSVSSWMRCSVEVSFYLGSILGSMVFSIYGHGQPIGNSLFPPCLSLYKWTMRNSLSFYPSSESLVHDKFSIFNVSNLYNFLAKRYVGSIDIMRWKKKIWKVILDPPSVEAHNPVQQVATKRPHSD